MRIDRATALRHPRRNILSESISKKQAAAAHLKSIVGAHLPKRCVRYSWATICGDLNTTTLGFQVDERPADGRVVDVTPEWITLKTAQNQFAVIHTSVLKEPAGIDVGAKVRVVPYARRRFDGLPLGSPLPSPAGAMFTTIPLGERFSRLQIVKESLKSIGLPQMIDQLEVLPADSRRTIAQALIDAGALDGPVEYVDPGEEDDIVAKPPSISFAVSTQRHRGRIQLVLDVASDTYIVRLQNEAGEVVQERTDVYFDDLDEAMIGAIDDGEWQYAHVTILQAAPKAARPRASHEEAPQMADSAATALAADAASGETP